MMVIKKNDLSECYAVSSHCDRLRDKRKWNLDNLDPYCLHSIFIQSRCSQDENINTKHYMYCLLSSEWLMSKCAIVAWFGYCCIASIDT